MIALIAAVKATLEQAGLLHEKACLLCAVSGGADSVALAYALARAKADAGFALHAVHVQHGLRGEASQQDEAFVRKLCRQLSIPLHVYTASLGSSMHEPGAETRARDARRELFAACMAQTGADALLTAHHRDDQTETVLMHLLRGSGLRGLCGMPESVPFAGGLLLRPFLSIPKAQLIGALKNESLPHREDESNQEAITPRNALRLSIVPAMEELYPGAGEHIAQAAEALRAEEAFLAAEADRLYRQCIYHVPPVCAMAKAPLLKAAPALVRRVLRRCYHEAARPLQALSHEDTIRLEKLLYAHRRDALNLPGGWMAVCETAFLHLTQTGPLLSGSEPAQPIAPDCAGYAFLHGRILQTEADGAIPQSNREVILTPEVLSLSPVLRLPLPQDRIHPLGAPGSKRLRRFFTDRKADPFFRYLRPVLAAGEEILWIPSLCTSEKLRLTNVPPGSIRLTDKALFPFDPHQSKE